MQSRTVEDPKIKEVLREAQNRVKSIALVHEKLYQSKSLDRIDYHDYLQKISRHLYDSYGVSPRNVTMNIHAENISLHIDKAVPCSLIINELLSNAFKHAFPDGRKGDVWIDIHKNGESLVLLYRDNGVGLPEDISIERSDSLGMRLLYGLTRQLHGTIEVRRLEGTHILITFPYDDGKQEA
jgi:two-component sensor histidine kinase